MLHVKHTTTATTTETPNTTRTETSNATTKLHTKCRDIREQFSPATEHKKATFQQMQTNNDKKLNSDSTFGGICG